MFEFSGVSQRIVCRVAKADLAAIFEVAQLAGVVWLNFDSEAAVIDGLPIFEMPDPAS